MGVPEFPEFREFPSDLMGVPEFRFPGISDSASDLMGVPEFPSDLMGVPEFRLPNPPSQITRLGTEVRR